jgi:hypothetical protein
VTPSPRSRRLRASAVAACSAVLLLAGCEAEPRTDAPVADKAAVEKPVAAPVADSVVRIDWKSAAYAALECTSRTEWLAEGLPAAAWDDETVRTTAADVTGDGADELLVQATCPAAVSTRADLVVVFGVGGASPQLLGVLGDDLFHPQAALSVDGTAVTLSGPTVAGDDPYCCPGHWGTVTYAWDGARFAVVSRSELPGTAPAATRSSSTSSSGSRAPPRRPPAARTASRSRRPPGAPSTTCAAPGTAVRRCRCPRTRRSPTSTWGPCSR